MHPWISRSWHRDLRFRMEVVNFANPAVPHVSQIPTPLQGVRGSAYFETVTMSLAHANARVQQHVALAPGRALIVMGPRLLDLVDEAGGLDGRSASVAALATGRRRRIAWRISRFGRKLHGELMPERENFRGELERKADRSPNYQ